MKKQLLLGIMLLVIFTTIISCNPNLIRTPIVGETYMVHQVVIVNDTLQYVEIYNTKYPNKNYFWIRVPIEDQLYEFDLVKLNTIYNECNRGKNRE